MATTSVTNSSEPPVRIPKLAVKNKAPESDEAPQPSTDEPPVISRWSASTTDDIQPLIRNQARPNRQPLIQEVEGQDSLVDIKGQSPKKKKTGGVKAFLTLKEPSAKAWENFVAAEQVKKTQGFSSSAFGSSKPLPDHVPKVNSKWDGLPESYKRKSAESKEAEKNKLDVRTLISRGTDSQGKPGSSAGTHSSTSTEGDSAQINAPPLSDLDKPVPPRAIPQSLPADQQLAPLPEFSTLELGQYDRSNAEKSDGATAPILNDTAEGKQSSEAEFGDDVVLPERTSIDPYGTEALSPIVELPADPPRRYADILETNKANASVSGGQIAATDFSVAQSRTESRTSDNKSSSERGRPINFSRPIVPRGVSEDMPRPSTESYAPTIPRKSSKRESFGRQITS